MSLSIHSNTECRIIDQLFKAGEFCCYTHEVRTMNAVEKLKSMYADSLMLSFEQLDDGANVATLRREVAE